MSGKMMMTIGNLSTDFVSRLEVNFADGTSALRFTVFL